MRMIKTKRFLKSYRRIILLSFSLLLILAPMNALGVDTDGDGLSDADEANLANTYSPTLQFVEGELFFPASIEYHLDNSILKRRVGDTINTIDTSPTIPEIAVYTNVNDNYFLENSLSFEEISQDYDQWEDVNGYFVYAHVKPDMEGGESYIVIQYWLFYAFNNGPLNDHQGDWEFIEIILNDSEEPLYASYSQHEAGEKTSWANVEKVDGTHPKVYVAQGSHANYFRSYQGNLGIESDIVGANGKMINYNEPQIVLLGEEGTGVQAWLKFAGRWGALGGVTEELKGRNGPLGPKYSQNGEKWQSPASWGLSLFTVDGNWFLMNWIFANFLLIFSILIIIIVVWKVYGIVKLHRKGGLRLWMALRTRASIGIILGIISIVLVIIALILPWYLVTINIQSGPFSTDGNVDVLLIDGIRGVQVNLLGEGLVQFFGMKIPFYIIILAIVLLSILDIIGMKSGKQIGRKYITGGITLLIPVIIIILFIALLASMLPSFASFGGGEVPVELTTISNQISSSPIIGSYSGSIGDYGDVQLSWGLGIGSYLLLIAAIVKIAGGIITSRSKGVLLLRPLPPPPPPPPLRR
ncbi:MAG: Vps62-related protein [archaeon]|nr:Vps62-related protein [archaeon]